VSYHFVWQDSRIFRNFDHVDCCSGEEMSVEMYGIMQGASMTGIACGSSHLSGQLTQSHDICNDSSSD
jgi:hypothetical protein